MFGFKSAQQKRIDDLVYDNRCLSEALEDEQRFHEMRKRDVDRLADERNTAMRAYNREADRTNKLAGRLMLAHRALREIAESVTPNAAYRARKMAEIAKAALPEEIASHVRPKASADAHAH